MARAARRITQEQAENRRSRTTVTSKRNPCYCERRHSQNNDLGFTMDAGHILVGVLTSAAVGWLVWAEMKSRRNTVRKNAGKAGQAEAADGTE